MKLEVTGVGLEGGVPLSSVLRAESQCVLTLPALSGNASPSPAGNGEPVAEGLKPAGRSPRPFQVQAPPQNCPPLLKDRPVPDTRLVAMGVSITWGVESEGV